MVRTHTDYYAHSTALIESDCIGAGTRIWAFVHVLKSAVIGCNCNIGDHCYIEGGVKIGDDVVIKNGVSLWTGVTIEDCAFIGPNVAFTNDLVPRAKVYRAEHDRILVKQGASIGANATLVCPLIVGRYALVGAGAVVSHNVPDFGLAYGNPAHLVGFVCKCGQRLPFTLDQDATATCPCGLYYVKQGLEIKEMAVGSEESAQSNSLRGSFTSFPLHLISLVDLRAQHDELRVEIEAAIREVVDTSAFIGGERVEAFEKDFAAFCDVRHAVACASGTDALKLALMAAGVRPGDAVVTVPHTFIATVEAITLVGAYPTFVDIDESTYTLSPSRLAEFLEKQCRLGSDGRLINVQSGRPVVAVLPVHLYGLPADMKPILELAERYHLTVIEDACQAHGATYQLDQVEKRAGSLGQTAAFSFYPGKNLGAMGEGGIVTTNDSQMDYHMRIWRDHGQSERHVHISPNGWNGRLDALQCAVLDIKLKKLDEWNVRRRQVAQWYYQRLADLDISLPVESTYAKHVYHLYVVRLKDRDRIQAVLAERGVATGLHYPIPLHLQEAYRHLGCREGTFPVSEEAARSILSLPMHPHLTEDQVDYVCRCLRKVLHLK
jgi:dTDP-4-amino-4,6-dideoxygalactose transaminase/acetyltransferase-like isoleucine patch superfamily enzyme